VAHSASFLCACGYNIRKILAHLRAWLALITAAFLAAQTASPRLRHSRWPDHVVQAELDLVWMDVELLRQLDHGFLARSPLGSNQWRRNGSPQLPPRTRRQNDPPDRFLTRLIP